jgi:hypothetical protein
MTNHRESERSFKRESSTGKWGIQDCRPNEALQPTRAALVAWPYHGARVGGPGG